MRPARLEDADDIARVQLDTWRAAYGSVLPAEALQLPDAEVAAAWRTALHRDAGRSQVLVALEGAEVVGFAASAPAQDADLQAASPAELTALLVVPRWGRRGHGSRLLAALVDGWREQGVERVVAWVFEQDAASRSFLEQAGWEPDGATRALDPGPGGGSAVQRQLRLHVDVTP